MTMRVTGLISGMDTESMITELTKYNSQKVDKLKGEQKKLEWTKDAWKDLNKEIVSFYKSSLSDLRFDSAFNKKATSVSDSSVATVVTGDNAMMATQKLQVKQLASAAYATGGKMSAFDGVDEADRTKASLGSLGIETGKFRMTFNDDPDDYIEIDVEDDDTMQSFINKLRSATSSKTGQQVNASFDAKEQRLYIASTDTGKAASFKIDNEGSNAAMLKALGLNDEGGITYDAGKDAKISLNGVDYESRNNTFSINGLTITAKKETKDDEYVTLTTEMDTSGIYDKIKSFLSKYNELVKKFDELYNAESAKDYDMLTDEEEYEMSEKQVEQWNDKIKAALLRRDSTLGTISSAFKTIMGSAYEATLADGTTKKLSLASFGIKTLSYFEAEDNERGVYHIDGDADDEASASNEDKLRALIASDPGQVSSFFKNLATTLYDKLTGLMSRTEFSSTYTVYEDKKMETQYNNYKTKIAEAQQKVQDMEDKYYKQFAAMEKALSKTQSQQSQLAGFLG